MQEAAENTYQMQDIQWGLQSKPFGGVRGYFNLVQMFTCAE